MDFVVTCRQFSTLNGDIISLYIRINKEGNYIFARKGLHISTWFSTKRLFTFMSSPSMVIVY